MIELAPLDTNYEIMVTLDKNQRRRTARAERYAMQSASRKMLPAERVARCLRFPVNHSQVEVWRHLESRHSFYANLAICGSVWTCPVCAAKISERRRLEIVKCTERHKQIGGNLSMLTLTVRHTFLDDLGALMEKLTSAMIRFTSGKRASSLRQKIGQIGTIRALEITHGQNGWHPHFHILIFHVKEIELEHHAEYIKLWMLACEKTGLESSPKAISLQDAEKASEYASKWGVEDELAKASSKRGRKEGNRTPFEILRTYVADPKLQDEILFQHYAKVFKGKRQLHWSKGLKTLFQIEDIDDETIANQKQENADLLGLVPYEIWNYVRNDKKDLRETLLGLTEDMPFELALEQVKKLIGDAIIT